jgi:hypothetical protein
VVEDLVTGRVAGCHYQDIEIASYVRLGAGDAAEQGGAPKLAATNGGLQQLDEVRTQFGEQAQFGAEQSLNRVAEVVIRVQ